MANKSYRESIRSYLPRWLLDRPNLPTPKTVGFRIIYSMTGILDAGAQVLIEGLQSRMPGRGTPTANEYIGRDRQILQGPNELPQDYAARLIKWLDYWRIAGNAYALLSAFQAYLSPPYPPVRLVTRNRDGLGSVWYTLNTDGSILTQRINPSNWDWDSISNPERDGYWSDFWVIAYEPHYEKDGNWGDGSSWWFKYPNVFGQKTTINNASVLRSLIAQWKGSHSRCRCLIFSYRANAYDPDLPVGDPLLPDGKWGNYSKDDGSGGRIKSRNEADRYWDNIEYFEEVAEEEV